MSLNLLPLVSDRPARDEGDVELGAVERAGPPAASVPTSSLTTQQVAQQVATAAAVTERASDIVTAPPTPQRGREAARQELHAAVDEVNAGIASIRDALRRLREAHAADLQATRPETIHELREVMRADVQSTASTAAQLKRRIEALDADRRRVEAEYGAGSAAHREYQAVVFALEKKLAAVLKEFSALRTTFERDHLAVCSRRYAAVAGHPPDEDELARLAGDAPREAAQAVFTRALAAHGVSGDEVLLKAALAEVQERHDAIVELERALAALHQLFLDLASLVDAQGDTVDSIEAQVRRSVEYVEKGRQHVAQARRLQRGVRIKVLLFMLALITVAVIIAVAIAVPAAVRG